MLDIGRLLDTLRCQGYDEVQYRWRKDRYFHEFRCVKGDRTVPFAISDLEVMDIKSEVELHVRDGIVREIREAFERE
jgi:hypothetical protein